MTDREAIKILEGFYYSETAKKYGDVPRARGLAISALRERIGRDGSGAARTGEGRPTHERTASKGPEI